VSGVIYALTDPTSGRLRYVGFTSQKPTKRLREHIYRSRKIGDPCYETPKSRWIRRLIVAGESPAIRILEITETNWQEAERRHIEMLRASGEHLLNVAEGGIGGKIPEESRRRAGLKLKNRYFSPEHRQRISAAKRGQPRPDSVAIAKRMAEMNRGRKMSLTDAERDRRRQKLIEIRAKGHWRSRATPEARAAHSAKIRSRVAEIWASRSQAERDRIAAAAWRSRPRKTVTEKRANKTMYQRIWRANLRVQEIGSCQIPLQS
jgi:hypothetical protein